MSWPGIMIDAGQSPMYRMRFIAWTLGLVKLLMVFPQFGAASGNHFQLTRPIDADNAVQTALG